ncbi:MAG: DUF4328 domain-containing protein [Pseudomonadota bacterium]
MQDTSGQRASNHFHKEYKDPTLPYTDGARSLLNISRMLKFGLIAFIPLAAFQAALSSIALYDVQAYFDLVFRYPFASTILIASSLIYRLVYIACIILSSWLLFRAARNLHTVAPGQLKTQPHWAWLWFFIPFANFFRPYEAVAEIDAVTRRNAGIGAGSSPQLLTWWILFIGSVFIGSTNISLPLENMFQVALILEILSGIAAIVAAILFMRITSELAQNQEHLKVAGVAHVFD